MIQHFAKQLLADIESTINREGGESSSTLKAIIESRLRKLNLITREEFDAQSAVLERTRARLEELEKQVAQLESQNAGKSG